MTISTRTPFSQYAGVFLVTLATLMFEILLTRIFSVNMWYHFAFMAISVAMFGMTVGALLVYLFPLHFTRDKAPRQLGMAALLFGVSVDVCFLAYLCVPFIDDRQTLGTLLYVAGLLLTYTLVAIPFVFSGICVCLALTRFPSSVSRLYAADLAGAAVGCVALVLLLRHTDAPTAVFVTSALALLGAAGFFFAAGKSKGWLITSLALVAGVAVFCVDNTRLLALNSTHIPMLWVKGQLWTAPLYQKWNTFSRITVRGNPEARARPLGWGFSTRLPDVQTHSLMLTIDANAATSLSAFHGNLEKVDYLRYDVVNLAHTVSPRASVLVVGAGGGRDVLSALVFRQAHVTAVEINDETIDAVNRVFGDFTGHLDRIPNVTFVNDEARSYIARTPLRYDMIQISLIDTWAATAAGAFVLTENSLYTQEAWQLFLQRLTPDGLLTVSRWHAGRSPGELYRTLVLARAALASMGVSDLRRHLFAARSGQVATVLVSPNPFSQERLARLEQICTELDYEVLASPSAEPTNQTIARLLAPTDIGPLLRTLPLNLTAPTDDSPFFFNVLRLKDFLTTLRGSNPASAVNTRAVSLLVTLAFVVTFLTAGCIVLPLFLRADRTVLASARLDLLYFAAIGLGFMFVEIAIMQRLNIFLGHPVYGLSVTLFSLLLSCGLGSLTTGRADEARGVGRGRFAGLLAMLLLYGVFSEPVIRMAAGFSTPMRISIAVAMLSPAGFFMGMALPLGMKAALAKNEGLTPWLWGVNGATSVCASVLAMVMALSFGIRAAFWTGFACYVLAAAALVISSRHAGHASGTAPAVQ